MNQRTSTSVVVSKGSANQFQQNQRRTFKNPNGSTGFAPSGIGSGTHSRQRSPALGAIGKEGKLFLATSTAAINLNDKRLENINGSFNLTMTAVPIVEQEPPKKELTHFTVKEEQHEEEEEEVKSKKLKCYLVAELLPTEQMALNDTAASTCVYEQTQRAADSTVDETFKETTE